MCVYVCMSCISLSLIELRPCMASQVLFSCACGCCCCCCCCCSRTNANETGVSTRTTDVMIVGCHRTRTQNAKLPQAIDSIARARTRYNTIGHPSSSSSSSSNRVRCHLANGARKYRSFAKVGGGGRVTSQWQRSRYHSHSSSDESATYNGTDKQTDLTNRPVQIAACVDRYGTDRWTTMSWRIVGAFICRKMSLYGRCRRRQHRTYRLFWLIVSPSFPISSRHCRPVLSSEYLPIYLYLRVSALRCAALRGAELRSTLDRWARPSRPARRRPSSAAKCCLAIWRWSDRSASSKEMLWRRCGSLFDARTHARTTLPSLIDRFRMQMSVDIRSATYVVSRPTGHR